MLPEIGATELLVIAAVALIVVGPKDLPLLLRKLGQFMGKLRAMANDFRASFDEMARQSELDELRAEVEAMRKGQFADIAAARAGEAELNQVFQDIDQGLSSGGMTFPPTAISETDAMEALPAPAPKPKAKRAPAKKPVEAAKPKAPAKPKAAGSRTRKSGTVT
jgi:sec-independent protein translocase protein TatB